MWAVPLGAVSSLMAPRGDAAGARNRVGQCITAAMSVGPFSRKKSMFFTKCCKTFRDRGVGGMRGARKINPTFNYLNNEPQTVCPLNIYPCVMIRANTLAATVANSAREASQLIN